ncbi:MAG TPA: hypothetical protein VHX37_14025 [Acidobacteriaceae bacterium]|jgi:hypothetical protein|nr:hypothetical protein [Acidobacteriaceae bacterium]
MVTMRSRPSSTMCARLLILLSFGFAAAPLFASDLPAVKAATSYPDVDLHTKEQVAIAAEPFDTPEKCKVFKVDFLKYRFLPIRIIVTNLGDQPISLRDARIYFIDGSGNRIPAAEPEDVERRITPHDSRGTNIPIGPIKLHTKGKDSDNKIEAEFDEFEYASLVVDPHSTRAGFLFYDMDGLGSQPLHGARLVFREVRDSSGNQLFFFEIPFDKYLAAQH